VIGPKYRLKTYFPDVSGLTNGAPVRLDGVEIGNVETITMVPRANGKPPERSRNIEVEMRIDKRYQDDILSDSAASLATEGVLGNRYVNVTRGFTGKKLTDRQEVPGTEEKGMQEVLEKSGDVLENLKRLSASLQDVVLGIKQGRGSVGKFISDDEAYNRLNSVLAKTEAMLADVQAGKGTLGKLVTSDEMYSKVDQGLDNVNGILTDVRAQKGTIGKLLYDPTLYDQAKEAINHTNSLLGDVRAGKGSLGKLATDDTLYNKLRDTSTNLASATSKLNDNTTSVGKLFSDPQLYDNLAGLTGDMRLLIGDFRQNPKKFLHIKITIF
jgi:phospholipid/cholesterol/gamma-HCH transport system substrate-binding protein